MRLKDGAILVLWDSRENKYLDKTDKVESYEKTQNVFHVKFYSSTKLYPYSNYSCLFCRLLETVNTTDKAVIVSGTTMCNISKVQIYENGFYKVYSNNSSELFKNVNIVSKSQDKITSNFEYYKKIADYQAKLDNDENSIGNYISSQYNKIKRVNPNSILQTYLSKGHIKTTQNNSSLIFPFDFNMSQNGAIKSAFNNQISVIEGPPGCGKTQTILNFIANAIIQNKKIAVVSNNNTAIKNITDKLSESSLSFFCALLGKSDNKKEFFDNIARDTAKTFLEQYANNRITNYDYQSELELLNRLQNYEIQLRQMYLTLETAKKEYQHFKTNTQVVDLAINQKLSSTHYKNISWQLENISKIGFFRRIKINRLLKIKTQLLAPEELISTLDNCFYYAYIKEIELQIWQYENFLKTNNYNEVKNRYMQASLSYFIDKLKNIANKNSDFSISTYKDDFKGFLDRYPVILSTSYSILGSLQSDYMLDYVIFDEASQSDLLSSILALNCAKNLIVVGDSKQLPEITEQSVAAYSKYLATTNNVSQEYWYHSESILSSVKKVFPQVATTFLREHYRCHPQIINFCNQKFYNGQLVIMTQPTNENPFAILHTVSGNHARKNPNGSGMYNQREIDEIAAMNITGNDEVGIISPFRYQADLITKNSKGNFECDTVHKFQGRQKKHIILSTVLNTLSDEKPNKMEDFVTNEKLLNVAVSRAAKKLTVIVSDSIYNSNNNTALNDLLKYIKYQSNSTVKSGGIISVFDILYNTDNKELQKLKRRLNKKQFLSEEIIKQLLLETLKSFFDIGFAMHIPLRKIIATIKTDDIKKQRYLTNSLTHTDFLIYNKITHSPLFAIEVDGTTFHEKNKKQTLHDSWKDECLSAYQIPILRLKTNGSNEKAKILELLNRPNA